MTIEIRLQDHINVLLNIIQTHWIQTETGKQIPVHISTQWKLQNMLILENSWFPVFPL